MYRNTFSLNSWSKSCPKAKTSASTEPSRMLATTAPTISALMFLNVNIQKAFSSFCFQNGAMNRPRVTITYMKKIE